MSEVGLGGGTLWIRKSWLTHGRLPPKRLLLVAIIEKAAEILGVAAHLLMSREC